MPKSLITRVQRLEEQFAEVILKRYLNKIRTAKEDTDKIQFAWEMMTEWKGPKFDFKAIEAILSALWLLRPPSWERFSEIAKGES